MTGPCLTQTPADLHAEDQLMRVRARLDGSFEIARVGAGWRWDVACVGVNIACREFPTVQEAIAHADRYTRFWWPLPFEVRANVTGA